MDEPTNDLDVETLELLEELLGDYKGTLLLVSHDREFIDNVVTSTLVLEGEGRVGDYVGGYTDWVRQRPNALFNAESAAPVKASPSPVQTGRRSPSPSASSATRTSASWSCCRQRIEKLEAEIAARAASMNEPKFYQQDSAAILAFNEASAKLQADLEHAYQRWNELDA